MSLRRVKRDPKNSQTGGNEGNNKATSFQQSSTTNQNTLEVTVQQNTNSNTDQTTISKSIEVTSIEKGETRAKEHPNGNDYPGFCSLYSKMPDGGGSPFSMYRGGIYKLVKKKETESTYKIADPIYVAGKYKDMQDGTVKVTLKFLVNGIMQSRDFPMDILTVRKIGDLVNYGFPIDSSYYKDVSSFLMKQQSLAPMLTKYSDVGFFHDPESKKLICGLAEPIDNDSNKPLQNLVFDAEASKFNIIPKGDLDEWLGMVKEEVSGNTPLEFILACGFASALIGYMYRNDYPVDSLIVNLTGDSTTGKTTAGMLAVSIFGAPTKTGKGLFTSWNGTSNAIIQSLVGNYGVPYLIDELSMSKEGDFSSFLYTIADGRNKKRLTKELSFQDQGDWATVIFSTGELSILSKASNNTGLKIRTLEFEDEEWTTSSYNSDNIKNCVLQNYGHAGQKFARYLMRNQYAINQWLIDCERIFLERLVDSQVKDRMASKYAIILAAANMANSALGLDLNINQIIQFIIEKDTVLAKSRDIGLSAWNHILEHIQMNQNNFICNGMACHSHRIIGRIDEKQEYYEVSILKNEFESAMNTYGYQSGSVIIKNLRSKGLIDHEPQRLTNRKLIFSNELQEQRKQYLGKDTLPQKLVDTVYTLKVPKEQLNLV
ncbi:DUF927 domain-containing protein [Viridibacillus arvi]|uniref:DUF927 domain-containing protein n=1 Tax=Viridibacillus arvi TaxID=263475 RepID=UPI00187B8D2E|nr:DUF927 domain-containing protein [Viridibacillus sp. JNUCC-6]QOV10428.1 DUF927 domain-containing protein [Viridibacillus sp. JNUCC-6]